MKILNTSLIAFVAQVLLPRFARAAYNCTLGEYQQIDDGLYLRSIANPQEKTVTMELAYNGFTWLAIGRSSNGAMIGSEAVIGRVDIDNSSTNPGKYYLSQESDSGVNLVDNQSLMDASIEVDSAGNTILRFTKYLEESGEYSISEDSSDLWVYAVGSTSGSGTFPTYHDMEGSISWPMTTCEWVADPTPSPIATPAPFTPAPITPAPVTITYSPTTPAPVTLAPITPAPVTPAPVTPAPTIAAPVTPAPTTAAPVTPAPTTAAPITPAPTTAAPTRVVTTNPTVAGNSPTSIGTIAGAANSTKRSGNTTSLGGNPEASSSFKVGISTFGLISLFSAALLVC